MTSHIETYPSPKEQTSPTSVTFDVPRQTLEPLSLPMQQSVGKRGQQQCAWVCPPSKKSKRTVNPVRAFIDPITGGIRPGYQRADGKNPISLANGDATANGNLSACPAAMEAVVQASLSTSHAASYTNACGTPAARQAIARFHSFPERRIRSDNVIVSNGCSGALELALTSLLDPGTVLLVPQPGFPLYQIIAESHGAKVVHYRLNPEKNWEIDFNHLEQIMAQNQNVRALVTNNPSSPTGSVFSEAHIVNILDFARRHRLPIVSDEIYGDLTFGSNKFHPMAHVAAKLGCHVPVITANGISKQFLLPGWRVGWLTFHDNVYGSLREVESGAKRLAQISLGASHLVQSAVPTLLSSLTPGLSEWKSNLRSTLEYRAKLLCEKLSSCHGLKVIPPQGAMYAIITIDTNVLDFVDDMEFTTRLVEEENVFVLPGSSFGVKNSFRVVCCSTEQLLTAAAERINQFCHRRQKHQ